MASAKSPRSEQTDTAIDVRSFSHGTLSKRLKADLCIAPDMDIHIDESGKRNSTALIMVHGAGGSSTIWSMQLRALSKKTHVMALDLNGHGKTPDRRPTDVLKSYLDDIESAVRLCDEPVLVGHSMGGALAQLYALDRSEDLGGLVLVGTGARLKVAPMIFNLLDNNPEGYFEALTEFMFHESAPKAMVQASQAEARKCPVPIIRRDFELCNTFDVMQRVSQISIPTLVIVGENDVMTPIKYAAYLHDNIANSDLQVLPQAGHGVMLERAPEFNEAVVRWLGV
jgi:pimeloyl-ACP methyl ester carboxylesterase